MAEFLEFSSVGLFCLFWAQVSIPFPPLNRILWVNSLCPDTRHWQHWHSCHGILCHGTLHCPSAASVFVQGFQAEPRAVLSRGLQPPGSLGARSLGKATAALPRAGVLPPHPALDTHEPRGPCAVTPPPSALGNFQVLPLVRVEGAREQAGEGRQVGQVQREELAWLPAEHKPAGAESSPQQGHFYSSFSAES